MLWTYHDKSFLPHGTPRDGRAAEQPIYLTASDDNPNAAQIRFLVDGTVLADASPYVRVAYVFEGRDAEAVVRARQAWQEAKARGNVVKYFQQDADGSWQQKA
jgi:DNA polymerase-3 subunit chi